jgi:formate dehydrogenase major subunit
MGHPDRCRTLTSEGEKEMAQPTSAVSRREFLKAAGGGFALGSMMALGADLRPVQARARSLKIAGATEVPSICPYCAIGCGTLVSVRDGKIVNIEGNPDSPISRGSLCPKGAASFQLAVNPLRTTKVKYRAPGATAWEERPLDWAMERIAQLVRQTREETFVESTTVPDKEGNPVTTAVNHTPGIASLGGATLDNEWNYVHLKLMRALGVVWLENQARI